jgi:molybdate transport repressor ModE-like protein
MSSGTHKFSPILAAVWRLAPDSALGDEGLLLALLDAIARNGSIAAAAREQQTSYRHAWGRIERWQARFGQPLVLAGRGSGSRLTPFAQQLLALDARVRKRVEPQLAAAQAEMAALLGDPVAVAGTALSIEASHDLAVAGLADLLGNGGIEVDLHFRGSLEALAALSLGRCDVAGFHCPAGALGRRIWAQYRRYLSPRKHHVVRVCERVQGLMVAPGNPRRIAGVGDLAKARVRFLNRQPGAGTRMVFDLLLQDQGLKPGDIRGYGSEEHTHAAVAALIAGGAADAGLGIEAAARRFGLDFVPLVDESYFFAFPRKTERSAVIQALTSALGSGEFRRAVAELPGYRAQNSGEVVAVAELDRSLAQDHGPDT